MAENIRGAGFALTVCDVNEAALAPFAAAGVRCVARAVDCADCDVVIVLVATPAQAHAVTLGDEGLRAGLNGRAPILVVMRTVAPDTMRELAREFDQAGVQVVDAPVSAGLIRVRHATLAIMMGGPRAKFPSE